MGLPNKTRLWNKSSPCAPILSLLSTVRTWKSGELVLSLSKDSAFFIYAFFFSCLISYKGGYGHLFLVHTNFIS